MAYFSLLLEEKTIRVIFFKNLLNIELFALTIIFHFGNKFDSISREKWPAFIIKRPDFDLQSIFAAVVAQNGLFNLTEI